MSDVLPLLYHSQEVLRGRSLSTSKNKEKSPKSKGDRPRSSLPDEQPPLTGLHRNTKHTLKKKKRDDSIRLVYTVLLSSLSILAEKNKIHTREA